MPDLLMDRTLMSDPTTGEPVKDPGSEPETDPSGAPPENPSGRAAR